MRPRFFKNKNATHLHVSALFGVDYHHKIIVNIFRISL